jgi:hypothetical protein
MKHVSGGNGMRKMDIGIAIEVFYHVAENACIGKTGGVRLLPV